MSPERAKSLIVEGVAVARAGDIPRARAILQEAAEANPKDPEAWLWLAGVAEKPIDAVRALERVLSLDPQNNRAKAGLKVARFEAGVAAAQANRRSEARALLLQATADNPQNESAWLWLAGATDDPIEAIGHLERALQLNPTNERARAGIETFRLRVKSAEKWRCPICEALESSKFSTCPKCHAILDLAQSEEAIGNPCPEMEDIRRGAERLELEAHERQDFSSHYYLGMALLNLSRPDEALPHFHAALELKPGDQGLAAQIEALEGALQKAPPPTVRLSASDREKNIRHLDAGRTPLAKSILVVDESATTRKLIGITMQRKGYRVVEASSGREAMEIIQAEGKPDLFVMDAVLPGMDGYTLCRTIRDNADTSETPVIMLTARDGFLDRMRGRMAGSNDYLAKPFKPEALANAVRECCPLSG